MTSVNFFTSPTRRNPQPAPANRQASSVQFGMWEGTLKPDTAHITKRHKTLTFDERLLNQRLRHAIWNNDLEELTTALNELPTNPSQRADIINHPDADGQTLLHHATTSLDLYHADEMINLEIVKHLLENDVKASINCPDMNGQTPLFIAVTKNNLETAALLLENGAQDSVNQLNPISQIFAIWQTPLYQAIANNNLAMAALLLKNGAQDSINDPDEKNQTLLHHAVAWRKPEAVKLLLENGATASVNRRDENGQTPLMRTESYDLAGLLLANGANPHDRSPDFMEKVLAHLNTTRDTHSETLVNPEATPEQLKEASQWFQWFPPDGGALQWNLKSTAERCNTFLNVKSAEFIQNELIPDQEEFEIQQEALLRRVHPVFESGLPSTSLKRLALQQLASAVHNEEPQESSDA